MCPKWLIGVVVLWFVWLCFGASGRAAEPDLTPEPPSASASWSDAPEGVDVVVPEASKARVSSRCAAGAFSEESLKDNYATNFFIGIAKDYVPISLRDLVTRNFNVITDENALKWGPVHPTPNMYNFATADAMVNFATQNGMQIIGHCLVWHQQTPDWVFQNEQGEPASRELLLQRLEEHIKTVVGRYKGRIRGWDVVNEALDDQGNWRNSPWYQILGTEYIVKAFQWAHEADPDTELYYNDYNIEDPNKLAGALRIVQMLQEKGLRIDAVGIQGHWNLSWPPVAQIESAMKRLAASGVKVNITELDISLLAWSGTDNPYPNGIPENVERQQGVRYAELFQLFRRNSALMDRITLWGITDDDSWISQPNRRNYPLLFNGDGSYKEAYWAVLNPDTYLATH